MNRARYPLIPPVTPDPPVIPNDDVATQRVDVPVDCNTIPSVPDALVLSNNKLDKARLVVELFVKILLILVKPLMNAFVTENPVAERFVVEAFEVKLLEAKNPDVLRLVVEAFVINAFVDDDRVNAASVVVLLVMVSLNAEKLVVEAIDAAKSVVVPFVTVWFTNVAVVPVNPEKKALVTDNPEAERLEVEALDEKRFVIDAPPALRLDDEAFDVDAFVAKNDEKKAPVADKLVVLALKADNCVVVEILEASNVAVALVNTAFVPVSPEMKAFVAKRPEADVFVVEALPIYAVPEVKSTGAERAMVDEATDIVVVASVDVPSTSCVPVVKVDPSVAPVADRLVVDAFAIVAVPVMFKVTPVSPLIKAFVAKRPPAEKLVVEAFEEKRFVIDAAPDERLDDDALEVEALVKNAEVANSPEADNAVVDAVPAVTSPEGSTDRYDASVEDATLKIVFALPDTPRTLNATVEDVAFTPATVPLSSNVPVVKAVEDNHVATLPIVPPDKDPPATDPK